MYCSIASADNLTMADDDFPEYPLIKRTGTHGLPPEAHGFYPWDRRALEAPRPGQWRTPGFPGTTAHGPDPVPLIPWLPLTLENCEV